jgi:hypothetical protein
MQVEVLEGLIKEAEEREKTEDELLKHSRRSRKVKELENKATKFKLQNQKQKI